MADTINDHPDLSALTGSPGQKRKRDVASSSPSQQRNKRTAPTANMDLETSAFIENAIEATRAHAHDSAAANAVNVADFSALQQAAAGGEHGEGSDAGNATSTAQAALGMYPTLHVPASTEEQFAAQAAAEGETFSEVTQHDTLMDVPPVGSQHPASNGAQGRGARFIPQTGTPNPKPSVGSEDWHKMRKDNHKEGK